MKDYKIILYYNYTNIKDPNELMESQRKICEELNIKGRIIVSKEGINGTLGGTNNSIQEYIKDLKSDSRFKDTHIKISNGDKSTFPKLSVKVRKEIVSSHLGEEDVNPNKTTGKYITAEELHALFESGKEFYIIDMRNKYEHAVGFFENSILPEEFNNFRDLPNILQGIDHLKDKKIVTVCTGGVRCEKASGYLMEQGFKDVSQLYGGIVTYMEKYPNTHFKGDLYVFDQRVVMAFNTDSPDYEIVGQCELCGSKSNNYVNCDYDPCHRHFICCTECFEKNNKVVLCSKVENHPEKINIKR